MALAEDISRRHGGASISDVAILIAMLEEDAGIAATVLRELNVELRPLYALLPTGLPLIVLTGPLPLAPEAADAFARAADVMREHGAGEVGTEHLLVSILRCPTGAASVMLARMRVSESSIRWTALRLALAYGGDPPDLPASTDIT
jgi:ATP-dependent Clp protease ATP-binding subunit ClpA